MFCWLWFCFKTGQFAYILICSLLLFIWFIRTTRINKTIKTFSDSFPANFHVLLVVLVHSGWLLHCRSAASSLPACLTLAAAYSLVSWRHFKVGVPSVLLMALDVGLVYLAILFFHLSLLSDLNVIRKRKMKWKKKTKKMVWAHKLHKL